MLRLFFIVLLGVVGLGLSSLRAQELRATLRINTQQLGTIGVDEFSSLERELNNWLNNTSWTNLKFTQEERIPCSFNLNILERTEDYKYRAELVVVAQRPVFNSTYTTSIALFRDKDLNFEYSTGNNLETNLDIPSSNLVSTLAYYTYLIIALDLDSFSSLGGVEQLESLVKLSTVARSQPNWEGWQSLGKDRNRTALYESFMGMPEQSFRNIWYSYHRLGLDMLIDNIGQGRATIQKQLVSLRSFAREHLRSPLLSLFEQTKLEEIVGIFSEAPRSEKEAVHTLLQEIFPTRSDIWGKLRN